MNYTYTIDPVNIDTLEEEIRNSSIIVALNHISVSTDTTIYFKASLSTEEKTILDGIVSSHLGSPTVDITQVEVIRQDTIPPFAAKILPDGSKLYERKHGVPGSDTSPGQTSVVVYTIPYVSCKITAVEVVGSKVGDQVDFKILDTTTGAVSQVPNFVLNQFGFGVFVSEGIYKEESRYDADLFVGLQLEMSYTNNGSTSVTPNFNVTLHEVKS